MLAEERRQYILGLIQEQGSARTAELARLLRVSDQTIRRDLVDLQEKGLVSKHHGGGVLLNHETLSQSERSELRHAEKQAIAQEAATLVRAGMVVALGPGTTTEQIAMHLEGRDIEVVTNSLAVARVMSGDGTRVRITGGNYRASSELVVGQWTLDNVSHLFVDIAFVGVSGIGSDAGYSVTERDEALVLRQFVRVAKRSLIVADSSKFHQRARELVAPPRAVHGVITDEGIPPTERQGLAEQCVEVRAVPP